MAQDDSEAQPPRQVVSMSRDLQPRHLRSDEVIKSLLITLIERGFTIPAIFAKFSRHTSSDPPHLHYVHFTASGANAFHLRFGEAFNLGRLIKL
jgi:hypothetical protein